MQILHIPGQRHLDLIHAFQAGHAARTAAVSKVPPVRLGRFQHRVDDGAGVGVGAGHCVTEQPGLAADDERADRVLGAIIVDRQVQH